MFVRTVEVVNEADREAIFRFRYRIYSEELHKEIPGVDHARRRVWDEIDEGAHILAAIADETGEIVGTLRTAAHKERPLPESLFHKLHMEPMVEALGAHALSYSGAFMVDPAWRGRTVASQLILHAHQIQMALGGLLDVTLAELALVRPYYQLGYRPFGKPFRPYDTAGLRAPLAIAHRDRSYLARLGSPLAVRVPVELDDQGATAQALSRRYPEFGQPVTPRWTARELWSVLAHSAPPVQEVSLFEGLSEADLERITRGYPVVEVEGDTAVYEKGERERGMGVLLSGRLAVMDHVDDREHTVAILGPGSVFGEMAGLMASGRTADLRAVEPVSFLVLPDDWFSKLQGQSPEMAQAVQRNLARILATRLTNTSRQVVHLNRASPSRGQSLRSTRPSTGATESYSFTTLGDPVEELARLERQARVGQDIEAFWLKRIGLPQEGTLLDLGSGPGITSLLLARLAPGARVVGVEPEAALRTRAAENARAAGMEDRCTFLEGTGQSLPLPDASVDFAYARFVFQHVPDVVSILKEMARVVRPGGLVVALDVDDGAVVLHPEPEGHAAFQARVSCAQAAGGGDRRVGRRLHSLFLEAGIPDHRVDILPITSHDLPPRQIVDVAFSFKAQTLERAGLWTEDDARVLREVREAAERPDAWFYVPVFLVHGRVGGE